MRARATGSRRAQTEATALRRPRTRAKTSRRRPSALRRVPTSRVPTVPASPRPVSPACLSWSSGAEATFRVPTPRPWRRPLHGQPLHSSEGTGLAAPNAWRTPHAGRRMAAHGTPRSAREPFPCAFDRPPHGFLECPPAFRSSRVLRERLIGPGQEVLPWFPSPRPLRDAAPNRTTQIRFDHARA